MYSLQTSILNKNFSFREHSLVLLFLLISLFLNAQSPTLSLGHVGVCNNTTVLVPITGNNLSDIGAITLFIHFDSTKLTFISTENIDPQLKSGLISNVLSNPSWIGVVWSSTTGANFSNTTLLNLKFEVLQKTGDLNFVKDHCEIANISLPPQIIALTYSDGSVFEALPTISTEPENKTVLSQSNVVFQVASPNASGFTWQEYRNDGTSWLNLSETSTYTGTQTDMLTIRQVPVNYNKFKYRCILNPNSCLAVSASAVLSVDSLAGITGQLSKTMLQLNNNPNPFSGKTTLEYSVPELGFATIKIFSMTGQIMGIPVESPHVAGIYRLEGNFVYLPAGIYFCQYVFKGSASMYETYRKMIKIN
jgi:hypothetical protein